MPEESNSLRPYDLVNFGEDKYWFETNAGVRYIAYFTNSKGYFPDNPEFNEDILSFTFEPVGEKREALYLGTKASRVLNQPHDPRILETITFLICNSLANFPEKVIMHICEDEDNLGGCRHRLFERFFKKFSASTDFPVSKYDLVITDEEYISMFITNRHIYHAAIRNAFMDIPNRLAVDKNG